MTTWSDLTTALKRLLQTLLKVIKGRISFKWMGEQESDTPLSSNERVPLGIQMKNANFRHAYYKNLTMNTEIQAEYILLNAHFKRLVNSIAKNNSGLEMLSMMPKALLCLSGAILHLEEDPSLFQKAEISEVSVHQIHSDCVHLGLLCLILLFPYCKSIGLNSRDKLHNNLLYFFSL